MPASKPVQPGSRDIWHRHAPEIRRLYQKNTVDNVRRIMEKESGFPEMALPTWIEKLSQLGIRKYVTKDEWCKIYLHCRTRLEDPTRTRGDLKLKRTKKKTEIVVRDMLFTWDKAWKNMKSAGAVGQLPESGEPLSPLPPDIIIRTPIASLASLSPFPHADCLPLEDQRETASGTISTPETSLIVLSNAPDDQERNHCYTSNTLAHAPLDQQGKRTVESIMERAELTWKWCSTDLPISHVINFTVGISNLAASSEIILQDLTPLTRASLATTSLSFESQLQWIVTRQVLHEVFSCPSKSVSTFTSQQNYITLFTVIYVVSNNLVGDCPHDDIFEILDLVFGAVPRKYLEALLHERLASIRAAFETLLDHAGRRNQRTAFQLLVQIGATYGWLAMLANSEQGHRLLYYAASMNLASVLLTLLDNGCRPDLEMTPWYFNGEEFPTAIVAALRCGNLQCAQILVDHCDVNKAMWDNSSFKKTNFECFLRSFGELGELTESGLEMFIRAGVDLEAPIELNMAFSGAHQDWDLSAADYLFYFHRSLFSKFLSKSPQVQRGRQNRAGILHSLEGGLQNLESYVKSLTSRRLNSRRLASRWDRRILRKVLQQLILEQFLIADLRRQKIHTNLATVHALSSFGTRFGASIKEVLNEFPRILHSFAKSVKYNPDRSHIEAALYLVENGATVTGKVLLWMSRLPDMRPLHLALGTIKDPKGLEIAVARAAEQNNFEAVERLIHAGAKLDVDFRPPESGLGRHYYRGPVSIIAMIISSKQKNSLSQMIDFLIIKGAPLRLSKSRPHLHHLLQYTLDVWGDGGQMELLERVQYIVGSGYDLLHSPFATAPLLEACHSTQVFKYLYRNGTWPRSRSTLAVWIGNGGGIELCREMLKAGADPNAYSQHSISRIRRTPLQMAAWKVNVDVVELLLVEGADVNAPAKGRGYTALQACCSYQPLSPEGQQRKLRTIRLLLDHGADVNAAPAREDGRTALQATAISGDLAAAKLLLVHAPMADVNAPPCAYTVSRAAGNRNLLQETRAGTALDCAAMYGRIDMVKLLLSYNALSHQRGETGYEGAIQWARRHENFAVADLIIQHADDARRSGTCPDLSQPWKDYNVYYACERGADWESECSDDEQISGPYSDVDDLGLSEEVWERNAVGCVSAHIHQDNPSDAYSLVASVPHDDSSTATINGTNAGPNQECLFLPQGEDFMAIEPCDSLFQDVGFDASTDFDMSFGSGATEFAIENYAVPFVIQNGDIGGTSCCSLPQRGIYEVGDDDE